MRRFRRRRKEGLEVFRILVPRDDLCFTLEQMALISPGTRDRALAEIALNQIVADWLAGWR
jgi:hypothetical protein